MKRLYRMKQAGVWLVALASQLMIGAANAHTFSIIKRFGIPVNVTGFEPSPLVQGADGTLYGTTSGGDGNRGTVFKVQPDGSGFATLKSFTIPAEGVSPYSGSSLALSGSTLYGTTSFGGNGNPGGGTVFKLNTDGSGYTVLKHFSFIDGVGPQDLMVSGNELYGMTSVPEMALFKLKTDGTGFTVLKQFSATPPSRRLVFMTVSDSTIYGTGYNDFNGNTSGGWVFKLNTDGTGYTVLRTFPSNENFSAAPAPAGSVLYGTTRNRGNFGRGSIFKLNTDGTGYAVLKHFNDGTVIPATGKLINSDGASPCRLEVSGNSLFGTAPEGGSSGEGTVFKVNTDGSGFAVLKHFTGSDGARPRGLMVSGSTLFGAASGGISDRGTLFKLNTDGAGFTVLKEFTYSDAAAPRTSLELSGSTLYGTTQEGGHRNVGTVFKVSTDGTGYTILKHFAADDGENPGGGLTLSGSVLYGTARSGGGSYTGSLFKINTDGTGFAVLKRFSQRTIDPDSGKLVNSDGAHPTARMELSGSTLYGTTTQGGSLGYGTVFKMNTDGTGYTVLQHFNGSDGASPVGRLALSGSILYGMTSEGGNFEMGTVFKMNSDGTGYTVLGHFEEIDGSPAAGPILSGSTLYGTTASGGDFGSGIVFRFNTNGTGYAVLKHFSEPVFDPSAGDPINDDGARPGTGLTLSGSTLYGTTPSGGKYGGGTIFQVNTDGTRFSTLRHISPGDDGVSSGGELTVSGSTLYGTMTFAGSDLNMGTVFKLLISEEAALIGMSENAGTARITFGGLGGLQYKVERSINLLNWTSLGTITMPESGEFTQVDNNAPIRAFYRAARVPGQ